MNKLKVVYKKVEDLIPYARNSRTHSDAQIAQIAASIKEFGWRTSILVDADNGIIAGHGRVLAARKLGLTELPTVDGSDMTETQKKAYLIADNKIAMNAGWDEELLMLEIEDLKSINEDVSILAFKESEIDELFSNSISDLGLLPEEKLNNFLNGDTKILRLAYDEQEFETVTRMLQQLQEKLKIEDFSTIVMALLAEKCKK
jgi:ParB-like chromosome segregation protein Spo0J